MAYAIIRIAKLTSQAHAHNATTHNYRQHEVSNADPTPQHPNREYLNHEKTDYWTLAEARIAEVVTRKVRGDQVRAVEVIMTGSPEGFIRDKEGKAVDYSKSKWAGDNLRFLQEKYGKENIVSFTLHQDEKTPHVHAVIVPITPDGRLSAKDIFNRQGLRELQTEYAQAMAPHKFERGIEHSQAEHQPMRRQYTQEAVQARKVAELSKPAAAIEREPFTLPDLPRLVGRDEWKTTQEARINAEIAARMAQVQAQERERMEKLAELAQVSTAAAEQVKTLQKQLSTSEGLKQGHYGALQTVQQEGEVIGRGYDSAAVQYAQGKDMPEFRQLGQEIIAERKTALTGHLEQILKGKVPSGEAFIEQLSKQGYEVERGTPGQTAIVHQETGAKYLTTELHPNEQAFAPQLNAAIERTAQQAKSQSQSRGGGIGMGGR
jgi:hypothetical protein